MVGTTVRAALTQTRNAFSDMPARIEDLPALEPRLEEMRVANVDHNVELIAAAAAQGCAVIGLGELFPAPYFALHEHPMWLALAEDVDTGPTVRRVREEARKHGIIVVAPIYELAGDRRFNTAVVIDENGQLLGKYRKTHVPRGRNEVASFNEQAYYDVSDGALGQAPGNVSSNQFFPVFATKVGRIGVAICYDRHFEGVVRTLAREGAQIVFSPAVTFGSKARALWEHEFATDAARHRVFIAGSNRSGREAPWNVEFFGASHFVGPEGPLEDLSTDPRVVVAELELARLDGADPSGWHLARDARPDIYSPHGDGGSGSAFT